MSLSPQQIRAAELLSQGHSHQEVGDAVKVSRRTILRWLKQNDFKNLSYGLVGRAVQAPQPVQAPQRSSERQSGSNLTVSDLIPDALLAVRDILQNPESRSCDRIKAASLVGQWAGLGQPARMLEVEAVKILIEAGWLPNEVLDAVIDGGAELEEKMKNALANGHQNGHENGHQNGHKKALLQNVSEEGAFDDEFDDEFDDDDE
jgi:hypothetical protein